VVEVVFGVDVDVPPEAVTFVVFFFVACSVFADLASVVGALALVFASFTSLFAGLADLPLEAAACAPFVLTVEPFGWAAVIFMVEPFD